MFRTSRSQAVLVVLLFGFLLFALAPRAHGQPCSVPGYPGDQPSPRTDHAMAYYDNGKVLLFGGRDAQGNYLADTWDWDGTHWTLVATTGPSPRSRHGMAKQPNGPTILLQGGQNGGGHFADTWIWHDNQWHQDQYPGYQLGSNTGKPLCEASYNWWIDCPSPYCYDVYALTANGSGDYREWSPGWGWANPYEHVYGGGRWHTDGAATSVSPLYRNIWVAYGGTGPWGGTTVTEYNTNELLSADAEQIGNPGARADLAMADDGSGALLFGGSNGDTQTWLGTDAAAYRVGNSASGTITWSIVATDGPGARMNHAMAYDPQRNKVVLFGGGWNGATFGDTWEWDGPTQTWTQVRCSCRPPQWVQETPPTSPGLRSEYAMAYDSDRDVVVLFGGLISTGGMAAGDTWEWDGTTWTLRSTSGPSARTLASMAYDPDREAMVLFGGFGAGAALQDTWEWYGTSWIQVLSIDPPPSARFGHVMAYDPPSGGVMLFGGSPGGSGSYMQDTWEWGGSTWTQRASSLPFPSGGRAFSSMAYDPGTQNLVLFGGQLGTAGGAYSNAAYTWNGTSWSAITLIPQAARPSARVWSALAFDPDRGHLVLFGGNAAAGTLGDTWEFVHDPSFPWSQLSIAGPSARYGHSMVYHGGRQALMLFGGRTNLATLNNETWLFLGDSPPNVVSASAPQSVCAGDPVTFYGQFSGPGPQGYEWRHDGSVIPGVTGLTYTIPSVADADAGVYTVTAGNPCGSATSPDMTLTVQNSVTILTQPQTQSVCPGGSATFSVTAAGDPPLTYQWRHDGVNISGATASTLIINPVSAGDAGSYDAVVASGGCGQLTSSTAALWTVCPRDLFRVNAGGPATASGDPGPAWSLDTAANPSPYVNAAATGNHVGGTGATIDMSDPSIPAGTPMSLFQVERYDLPGGAELTWNFPTGPGSFEVRLYFAEIYTGITGSGQRVFDVSIEGQLALDNLDVYAEVGLNRALVKKRNVTVIDGELSIMFVNDVLDPFVCAIEIVRTGELRVNVGGPTIPSGDAGPAWGGDTADSPSPYVGAGTNTGSTAELIDMSDPSIPAGTPMSMLQIERWDPPGGPEMTWNFPTGAGTFLVRLYFAEIYSAINGSGQRVFDVVAEGVTMLDDVDLYAMVGSYKAVAMSFSTAVVDSFLTLTFVHGMENPTVFGIQIVPQVGIRVNAGGPETPSGDAGPAWSVDLSTSPSPYVNAEATGNWTGATEATIDMSDPSVPAGIPMSVFQWERFDQLGGADMTWNFPTGPGAYEVKLCFAEIYAGINGSGQRVFDVNIEGQLALDNLDIYAEVGLNKALVKRLNVTVADGILEITFLHGVQNPFISAIEIVGSAGQPLGACCHLDGNCTISTAASCQPPNSWGGDGSSCNPNPCAPPSGVAESELPRQTELSGATPNPLRSFTSIRFALARPGPVSLSIYDVSGRRVRVLFSGEMEAGTWTQQWNGRTDGDRRVPAGVYYCRLVAESRVFSRTLLLVN